MAVNRKIVEDLIACKQTYDKKYLDFPFKNDLEALFKHEYDYYLTPIFLSIVPLMYKETKIDSETNIEDYFPYIVFKYQEIIKKEVLDFEKNNAFIIKGMGKQILDTFLNQLMLLTKADIEAKNEFIAAHFKQYSKDWMLIFRSNPMYGLEICANLRNPIMQKTILTYLSEPIKDFINSKSWESFESQILPLFSYPLDISVKEYYDKWIAKEYIHIKFSKEILGNYYEQSKKILKDKEKEENYKRKQEHYERVQRKYKKLKNIKSENKE